MKRLLKLLLHTMLLVLIGITVVQIWFAVHLWYWADHNPASTAFMQARLEALREIRKLLPSAFVCMLSAHSSASNVTGKRNQNTPAHPIPCMTKPPMTGPAMPASAPDMA